MSFPGFEFQKFSRGGGGGHAPGPPSYAGPRILLQSDFKLDPPLLVLMLMSMLMSYASVDFFVLSFVLSCAYAYVTSENQA